MLKIKPGAKIKGLHPELVLAASIASTVYMELYGCDCVITSAVSGTHMDESLHYLNYAIDLRVRNLPSNAAKQDVAAKLAEALGDNFDVVPEYIGQSNEHLHVEFDPK